MAVLEARASGTPRQGAELLLGLVGFIGLVLVMVGSGVLLYLVWVVVQAVNEPQSIGLLRYFMEQVGATEMAVFGQVQSQPFSIQFAAPLRTALFIIVGVLILSALAGILKAVVGAGVQLISMTADHRRKLRNE